VLQLERLLMVLGRVLQVYCGSVFGVCMYMYVHVCQWLAVDKCSLPRHVEFERESVDLNVLSFD
jgi:hypothetical protein